MYHYKKLTNVSNEILVSTIKAAFVDNSLPVFIDEWHLTSQLKGANAVLDLSFGAFYKDELVGFMINAIDYYQGYKTAFDLASGVLPEHRKKGVFAHLFAVCKAELVKHTTTRYYIEIQQDNRNAIQVYKNLGFTVIRELSCFEKMFTEDYQSQEKVYECELLDFDISKTKEFFVYYPSFENSNTSVARHGNLNSVVYCENNGKLSAYIIYVPTTGIIRQCGYSDINLVEQLLFHISKNDIKLRFYNIDKRDTVLIDLLNKMGFQNIQNKIEMSLMVES